MVGSSHVAAGGGDSRKPLLTPPHSFIHHPDQHASQALHMTDSTRINGHTAVQNPATPLQQQHNPGINALQEVFPTGCESGEPDSSHLGQVQSRVAQTPRHCAKTGSHTLICIPSSHYVERARWALDLAGIHYTEDQWPPLLHFLGTYWAAPDGGSHATPMLQLPRGLGFTWWRPVVRDAHNIVAYVREQCSALQLYPSDPLKCLEVELLERTFSAQLAVNARVVFYHALFRCKEQAVFACAGAHISMPWWRKAAMHCLYSFIQSGLCESLDVTDSNAQACTQQLRQTFQEVSRRLLPSSAAAAAAVRRSSATAAGSAATASTAATAAWAEASAATSGLIPVEVVAGAGTAPSSRTSSPRKLHGRFSMSNVLEASNLGSLSKRNDTVINDNERDGYVGGGDGGGAVRYLVGDGFTAADLTFASLAALVLVPAEYGAPLVQLHRMPADFQALVHELRATPAGHHALEVYRQHRRVGKKVD